jgi:hypothetical protein
VGYGASIGEWLSLELNRTARTQLGRAQADEEQQPLLLRSEGDA